MVSPRGYIKWGEKARNKVRDLLGYIEKEKMKRWKKGKKIRQIVHGRKKLVKQKEINLSRKRRKRKKN